jgi:hypothetical protein
LEVADAEPLAGALFQRSFQASIPDFPKHFVLAASDPHGRALTLGYVHFTAAENIYLGGGMCVNTRALKWLPRSVRQQLNEQGGVAYTMLSSAVKQLDQCDAVFGYVGHQGAYRIDLAVGFEQTQYPHLIVYWKKQLEPNKQQAITEQAHQFGPF